MGSPGVLLTRVEPGVGLSSGVPDRRLTNSEISSKARRVWGARRAVTCLGAALFPALLVACAGTQRPEFRTLQFEVENATGASICGFYVWLPGREGNTGLVATSPEMNNLLEPGTYLVAEGHPSMLPPGKRRQFGIRVRGDDTFHVRARNCDDQVVFEQKNVSFDDHPVFSLGS